VQARCNAERQTRLQHGTRGAEGGQKVCRQNKGPEAQSPNLYQLRSIQHTICVVRVPAAHELVGLNPQISSDVQTPHTHKMPESGSRAQRASCRSGCQHALAMLVVADPAKYQIFQICQRYVTRKITWC
jgi:hypothetical protein